MGWREEERLAAKWFKENYDSESIYMGKSDCNQPDIISKKYGIVEIKGPKAQCGQFTESKINDNPFNQYIASKKRSEVTKQEANDWCRHFYEKKKANYFITYDEKRNYVFMTRDEYFNTHTCKLQLRTVKKSGPSPLPKMYYKYIPKEWNYQMIKGRPYVLDQKLWDTHYEYIGRTGEKYIMCPTHESNGEIRKLSNTYGTTWIFSVQ